MTEEFPFNKSEVKSEIHNLISEKGLNNLTGKIIRRHLEEKLNCKLDAYKIVIDQITLEQINSQQESPKVVQPVDNDKIVIKPAGLQNNCLTEDFNSDNSLNQKHATSSVFLNSDLDKTSNDKLSDSYDSDFDLKNELVDNSYSKVRKRKANGVEKHNLLLNIEAEDMATVVKRRRGATVKQKREVQKKPNSKSKESKGPTAYQRICVLSDDLYNLTGKRYMRRSDVVKWMWAYFNDKDLKDPKNKQMIILDENLKTVFGHQAKRIKGFTMMQRLQRHIKDAAFLDAATQKKVEAELSAEDEEIKSSLAAAVNQDVSNSASNELELKCDVALFSSKDSINTASPSYPDTLHGLSINNDQALNDEDRNEETKSKNSSSGESSSSDSSDDELTSSSDND